jgi:deazaflavin-dependent oxidoreductase (nitroreductase family)
MPIENEKYAYVTTTGRKSGLPRQIEIWFVATDGKIYILAEHGLKAQWVQNILVNPEVHVKIGDQEWNGTASVLDPEKNADVYIRAQELSRQKYDWGDGLPVEISLGLAK